MKLSRILSNLKNKTVVITGASRGIGKKIALKCAKDGAHVALLARSGSKPSHYSLEGDLESVAKQVNDVGGIALPIQTDLLQSSDISDAIEKTMSSFGKIDAIVNNASAINLKKNPSPKEYDLMMGVNARGTANMISSSYDFLLKSDVGHILTISPPMSTLSTKWLAPHPTYTTSKYAMTMITLGYSDTFRANTLWPKKLIATAATKMLEKQTGMKAYSKGLAPEKFADIVHEVLCSDITGMSCLDSDIHDVDEGGIDDIFIN